MKRADPQEYGPARQGVKPGPISEDDPGATTELAKRADRRARARPGAGDGRLHGDHPFRGTHGARGLLNVAGRVVGVTGGARVVGSGVPSLPGLPGLSHACAAGCTDQPDRHPERSSDAGRR
jgi:hypothetical protein